LKIVCFGFVSFGFEELQWKVEKMLPCDKLFEMYGFGGLQGRWGPWLINDITAMRRMISDHEKNFGIIHAEVGYLQMISASHYEQLEYAFEKWRPLVTLNKILRMIPAERRSVERDIDLMRHFSVSYGWEELEE
jgi:hypothetical protein